MRCELLPTLLAEKVLGWKCYPDRFVTGKRTWIPRWRFRPLDRIEDAFSVLDRAAPDEFTISGGRGRQFRVWIRIGHMTGEAAGESKPATITYALAKALGLEVRR